MRTSTEVGGFLPDGDRSPGQTRLAGVAIPASPKARRSPAVGYRIGRTLVLLKIAYREEYAACGPGNVLLARTIERAFAGATLTRSTV